MKRQNPTPVGRSGYVGTAARSSAATSDSGSLPGGQGLFAQNRGSEQISALFENGVMVPMRTSDAAQPDNRSSQPRVTTVSELSSRMSASRRASAKPRFAVSVKPVFFSLASSVTRKRRRARSPEKYARIAGSGEASSISSNRQSPVECSSTLSTQRARSAAAL